MTQPTDTWRWNGYAFRAMNTKIQTWLFSQTDSEVLVDIQRFFHSVEKRLSRFDPDSELSRLNRSPYPVFRASPMLMDALEVALWAAHATGGLFDPTVLNALHQAGYSRSFEQIHTPAPLHQTGLALQTVAVPPPPALKPFSYRSIQLNRARSEVSRPVGLEIDLGGMGKGWTVDRAADRLQGLGPFLINAGGDIYAYQTPPGKPGWSVDIVHPFKDGHFAARLFLQHEALATSTIARRRWRHNGQIMHHLIDPRTGLPAHTDAVSVSVTAPRTVLAEIYAKVVLILGTDAGLEYLNQIPGVEGLIITANHQICYTHGLEAKLDRVDPSGYRDEQA